LKCFCHSTQKLKINENLKLRNFASFCQKKNVSKFIFQKKVFQIWTRAESLFFQRHFLAGARVGMNPGLLLGKSVGEKNAIQRESKFDKIVFEK